jgi:hypothetical protein
LEPPHIRVREYHIIGPGYPDILIYSSNAKKDNSGVTLKMIPLKTGDENE